MGGGGGRGEEMGGELGCGCKLLFELRSSREQEQGLLQRSRHLLSRMAKTVSEIKTAVICFLFLFTTEVTCNSLAPSFWRSSPTTTLVPLRCMATISLQTAAKQTILEKEQSKIAT